MSLLSRVTEDLERLFDPETGLGVAATYIPSSGGGSVDVVVLISYGGVLDDKNWRVAVETNAVVMIKEADVSQPAYKDEITIDGETWTVVGVSGPNAGIWRLEIRKEIRPTFKGQL